MDSNVDHSSKIYIFYILLLHYTVYSFHTAHDPPLGISNSLYSHFQMLSVSVPALNVLPKNDLRTIKENFKVSMKQKL